VSKSSTATVNTERERRHRLVQMVHEDPMDPDAAFFFAAWLSENGSKREALDTLHKVTNKHPSYPGIWRFKASIYEEIGDEMMAALCRARAEEVQSLDENGEKAPAAKDLENSSFAELLSTVTQPAAGKKTVRPRPKKKG